MTQPDSTPDYPRDVPPEVLAIADKAVLRMHELLDGAPLALVVEAYRAGKADGYRELLDKIGDALSPARPAPEETP